MRGNEKENEPTTKRENDRGKKRQGQTKQENNKGAEICNSFKLSVEKHSNVRALILRQDTHSANKNPKAALFLLLDKSTVFL